jgi:transcriptional regulator GlxA family with amidase domain
MAVPLATAALHELIVRAHAVELGLIGLSARVADGGVRRAIRYLEAHAAEALGPTDVARALGISYAALRRRFRSHTGFSLQEYAIAVRLRRAKELLYAGEHSVAEVAAACGFADPYYFTRLFTRRVGMSPSRFRREGGL